MRFARAFQPRTPRIRISISLYRRTIVSAAAYASLIVSSFLRDTILYIYIFFSFPSFPFLSSLFFSFHRVQKVPKWFTSRIFRASFSYSYKSFFFYNSLLIIKNCILFLLFVSFFLSKNRMIIVYD